MFSFKDKPDARGHAANDLDFPVPIPVFDIRRIASAVPSTESGNSPDTSSTSAILKSIGTVNTKPTKIWFEETAYESRAGGSNSNIGEEAHTICDTGNITTGIEASGLTQIHIEMEDEEETTDPSHMEDDLVYLDNLSSIESPVREHLAVHEEMSYLSIAEEAHAVYGTGNITWGIEASGSTQVHIEMEEEEIEKKNDHLNAIEALVHQNLAEKEETRYLRTHAQQVGERSGSGYI